MSRLIDADATKVSITRYFETHIRNLKTKHILIGDILKGQMKEVCTDVCFGIDAQPTVDAVKHGEWKVDMKGYPHIICSLCDVHIPMVAGWCMDAHINYCPNCGAKMDLTQSNDSNVLNALDGKEQEDDN